MNDNLFWLVYGAIWFSVSLAVCVALYITKEPKCLLALSIPMFIRVTQEKPTEKEQDND